MYVEINGSEFVSYFNAIRPEQFSYDALRALFEYYAEIEESTGEQIKLDVIALCCDWTEYKGIEDFQNDYKEGYDTISDIENDTTVIEFDGGFLVEAF
jgi:hypothetical protein